MSIQSVTMAAVLILSISATACVPQAPTQPAGALMDKPTAQAMMEKPTAQAMMDKPTATPSMPADGKDSMTPAPKWFSLPLKDARSAEIFKISDFLGKVVLLEDMATWCPNCTQQQKEVKLLHTALGKQADLVTIGLGVDLKEDAALLKAYIEKNGFDWKYAIATSELARELGALYGDQYLNPSATPMLIIDRKGQVHTLPFGIKSAAVLEAALKPFLEAH